MPKVTVLPATLTKFTAAPITAATKRKVAGYARVSTDKDDQFTSYQAQIDYYTNYIKGRSDWQFVDVYTDEGITGTSVKHREGFKRMIADALGGKIDLIITKSVSRFARNTVDSLTTIRKLKENGIEVFFEKENIWTFDGKGELLLTIMSSLAQEESRSISENCTWGQRKRFADGKVTVPFGRFLGYDRGPDGNLVVNHEQAVIIRHIFDLFLSGRNYTNIAETLASEGVRTPSGTGKWSVGTVKSILSNEKYKGDALLQKKFTVDFLSKKQKVNEGEVPQYYVEGNHEAIIAPATFDYVQSEMIKRAVNSRSSVRLFSGKIKCGDCGGWYGSKVWHSTSKYRKLVWRCNEKYNGAVKCTTPRVTDEEARAAVLSAIGQIFTTKKEVLRNCRNAAKLFCGTAELETERDTLMKTLEGEAELANRLVTDNARAAFDQHDYREKYDALVARYEKAKRRLEEVKDEIQKRQNQFMKITSFAKELEKSPHDLADFEEEKWFRLVEFMTVYANGDIIVTFQNGQAVKA